MSRIYQIGIRVFILAMRIASLFNGKIKEGIEGRKNGLKKLNNIPENVNVIWFHCASLGEFDQGLPVMTALKKTIPNAYLLVSFFSPSGMKHYQKRNHTVDQAIYLPFDTINNAKVFLQKVRPSIAVFIKYEFWPNLILQCKKTNVKTVSISTLLRKDQIYFKWYGGFFAGVLKSVDFFFVQNQETKSLLESIGADNVEISGDTRYDRVLEHRKNNAITNDILDQFTQEGPTLIVGSSWEEEEKIVKEFLDVDAKSKVIIAPHNVNEKNIGRIQSLLDQPSVRYTQFKEYQGDRVLILDTIGHLSSAYQYADYALIGGGFSGSLHNILEAGVWGLPVFFGPHHLKFPEAEEFINAGIGYEVENSEQLLQKINELSGTERLKEKINAFFQNKSGATKLILESLSQMKF
tara:strand:- start:664 stop:1884 length:1221 start_codon:yes stop_codon:yes gene_type:complete